MELQKASMWKRISAWLFDNILLAIFALLFAFLLSGILGYDTHSAALDAGRLAAQLGVRNLLLYHTEDATLATRKAAYTAEAAQHFAGNILVPDDLEVVTLSQK